MLSGSPLTSAGSQADQSSALGCPLMRHPLSEVCPHLDDTKPKDYAGYSRSKQCVAAKAGRSCPVRGHSLHFGSVSMSGLPPTTTEWRTFDPALVSEAPGLGLISIWRRSDAFADPTFQELLWIGHHASQEMKRQRRRITPACTTLDRKLKAIWRLSHETVSCFPEMIL
jgi:hypothetical protein